MRAEAAARPLDRAVATDHDGDRFYRLYGITAAADFDLDSHLNRASGPADLRLTFTDRAAAAREDDGGPVFSAPPNSRGETLFRIHRTGSGHVVRFTGVADYRVSNDRIDCHVIDPAYRHVLEIYLFGTVMSFWLESWGVPALHASAVSLDGRAVAFLAGNRAGKTSLAAALMAAGHPLLTDDILALDDGPDGPLARPGYPRMRMWPAEAERFLGRCDQLERVHPDLEKRWVPVGEGGLGRFCDSARPLAAIYLPRRRAPSVRGGVEIVPVAPHEALLELLRTSFVPNVAAALGWSAARLRRLSRVVRRVPVRRLVYPDGFEHLFRVRDAIVADARGGQ